MQLIDLPQFADWAKRQCVQHCKDSLQRISFRYPTAELDSSWTWPEVDNEHLAHDLAEFVFDVTRAALLDTSHGAYLLPAYGQWNQWGTRVVDRLRVSQLESIGIPSQFEGAAYFTSDELDTLATAVFTRCFLFSDYTDGADDIYMYPEHGELYLWFDDDEVVSAHSQSVARLERLNALLKPSSWYKRCRASGVREWPIGYGQPTQCDR